MKKNLSNAVAAAMLALAPVILPSSAPAVAREAQATPPGGQPHLSIPGSFVRVVYNDEGWVTLGYATANASVGQEWMLLEVGLTTRPKFQATITRHDIAVILPDGTVVPLAGQKEYNAAGGKLRSLNARANVHRQSINYFPPSAKDACRIGFFSDTSQRARTMTYDRVSLDWRRGCVGRLFFHLPEKIRYGRYYLQVKFPHSTIRVPFRIMTEEELKAAKKKLKELKKEAKADKK